MYFLIQGYFFSNIAIVSNSLFNHNIKYIKLQSKFKLVTLVYISKCCPLGLHVFHKYVQFSVQPGRKIPLGCSL